MRRSQGSIWNKLGLGCKGKLPAGGSDRLLCRTTRRTFTKAPQSDPGIQPESNTLCPLGPYAREIPIQHPLAGSFLVWFYGHPGGFWPFADENPSTARKLTSKHITDPLGPSGILADLGMEWPVRIAPST